MLSLLPDTFWRQRNRWLAYLVGDGKVQLDRDCTSDVTNGVSALERFAKRRPAAPLLQQFGNLTMGRGLLLWLLGIPIPVIILLYVFHLV